MSLPSTLRGQSTVATHYGIGTSSTVGIAIARAGDLDNDGVPDYLVADSAAAGTANPAVVGYSGRTHLPLVSTFFPFSNTGFGASLAGEEDFDNDQIPDYLVGAPYNAGFGNVYVYSGATGLQIRQHSTGIPNDFFGGKISMLDDVNHDGVRDYAIASTFAFVQGSVGSVRVFNGANGIPLYVVSSNNPNDKFGYDLESVDDVTGDGIGDLVISAPSASVGGFTFNGAFYVFSGASGFLHLVRWGTPATGPLGVGIASLGDVDGDGSGDLALTGWPGVIAMSIATGTVLGSIAGPPGFSFLDYSFGGEIDATDDIDGDGWPELLITLWTNTSALKSALVLASVRTGEYLYRRTEEFYAPPFNLSKFPARVLDIGDTDGDGLSEWLISDPLVKDFALGHGGWAEVLSRRRLYAAQDVAAPSQGMTVTLELNGGLERAGQQYLVLASVSGTSGIPIGQQSIPLTYDSITNLSILFANTPVFANTFATMNGDGKGTATFDASYLPPAANGVTFWFSFVATTPGGYFVSNAESIRIDLNG